MRDAINGVRVYTVPKAAVNVGELFEKIEAQKATLGIKDWGLSQTSLEEVFLTIVANVRSFKHRTRGALGARLPSLV